MLREFLEPIASDPSLDEVICEYPCDYEDTYDLGFKNGRTQLAREILNMLKKDGFVYVGL